MLRSRKFGNRRFFRRSRFAYPSARGFQIKLKIRDRLMLSGIFARLIRLLFLRAQFRRGKERRSQSGQRSRAQQVPARQFILVPPIQFHVCSSRPPKFSSKHFSHSAHSTPKELFLASLIGVSSNQLLPSLVS